MASQLDLVRIVGGGVPLLTSDRVGGSEEMGLLLLMLPLLLWGWNRRSRLIFLLILGCGLDF